MIEIPYEKIHGSIVAVKRCQDYIKMYKSFKIKSFNDKDPICYVAHQNFVSLYDIIGNRWIKHMLFQSDIVSLFE